MISKKRFMLLSAIMLIALAVAGCYKTPEQRAERLVNHIAEKLDLNAAQKAKLNAIKDEFMAKAPATHKSREETFTDLVAFMRAPSIDQDKMNMLIGKNRDQADEMIRFVAAKFGEFHDLLTPEQREKAAKMMEEWRERHADGHH